MGGWSHPFVIVCFKSNHWKVVLHALIPTLTDCSLFQWHCGKLQIISGTLCKTRLLPSFPLLRPLSKVFLGLFPMFASVLKLISLYCMFAGPQIKDCLACASYSIVLRGMACLDLLATNISDISQQPGTGLIGFDRWTNTLTWTSDVITYMYSKRTEDS